MSTEINKAVGGKSIFHPMVCAAKIKLVTSHCYLFLWSNAGSTSIEAALMHSQHRHSQQGTSIEAALLCHSQSQTPQSQHSQHRHSQVWMKVGDQTPQSQWPFKAVYFTYFASYGLFVPILPLYLQV